MSGQWEVVGKKKDKSSNKLNPQKNEKEKKKLANGVKVEEVLAVSQLKNLYASNNNKGNKENQKPAEKQKVVENVPKKVAKKIEKPQEPKPKPPKSIEAALNAIKADEFNAVFEKDKTLFPDMPIVWLRELAQFLNMRVPIDVQDPVFNNKPESYPLSVMPLPLRNVIEKAVKEANSASATFFDICLTAMANDMNKDLPALGHKFFLQYLASNNPKLVTANISKYNTLRTSYQNRPTIGLSILWALAQGGFKDLNVGLKVFQEIMFPLLEMKNYSRYILKYLINLINKHKDASITKDQYLFIMDVIYSNKKNVPSDLNAELTSVAWKLNEMIFKNGKAEKYYIYIEPLLKKLVQNTNSTYRNLLCETMISSMENDNNCLGTWGKVYTKNLVASSILLNYIEKNWKGASKKVNTKVFAELLKTYKVTNEELLLKKRRDDGLTEAIEAIKRISDRMEKGKQGVKFPFRFVTFALLLGLSTFIFFDVRQHGSWNNSAMCKALNKSGVYDYTNKALDRAKEGSVWVQNRLEEQFPGVTAATVEFTTPYIELGRDVSVIVGNLAVNAKNGVAAKIPIVLETIESYAPGLLDQIKEGAEKTWATVLIYYDNSKNYLMTQVFVGKLAPEEIMKVIQSNVDAGLVKVTEGYHWICEKVNTAIK